MGEKHVAISEGTLKLILENCDEVDKDPKVRAEAEEYQKQYGTLTEGDLRKVIRF